VKTGKWIMLASSLAFLLTVGCAMNRANITALSEEQQIYYNKLGSMLQKNRSLLELGLKSQLEADRVRELNLMNWVRDLQKAEVLLQSDANVTGNQKLLSMKLAELNLEATGSLSMNTIDQSRKEAILELYDKLSEAVALLEKNNDIILKYLGSNDKEFALRSLDVEGIVRMVSTIRSLQEELGEIEERSEEQRQKENERIRKSIERTQDLLIEVFKE
jgi:hypothetical protein